MFNPETPRKVSLEYVRLIFLIDVRHSQLNIKLVRYIFFIEHLECLETVRHFRQGLSDVHD